MPETTKIETAARLAQIRQMLSSLRETGEGFTRAETDELLAAWIKVYDLDTSYMGRNGIKVDESGFYSVV